jgi:hypothetical protein
MFISIIFHLYAVNGGSGGAIILQNFISARLFLDASVAEIGLDEPNPCAKS